MNPDARRMLGFFVAVVVVGGGGVLLGSRLLGLAAGPEAEVITLLKRSEADGLDLDLGIAGEARSEAEPPLRAKVHHFDRFTVSVDTEARTAVAIATLDFTGSYGATKVSSLGVEKIPFRYQGFGWKPAEGFAPRLAGICAALERRRRALEAGDLGQLAALAKGLSEAQLLSDPAVRSVLGVSGRRYRVRAWYIRSERDEVLVSEEYTLSGSLPERPVDEEGTRRLVLTRIGREFSFSEGLM